MKLLESKEKRAKQLAGYYPKNIGLSLPGNIFDYEFLICGKNVPYTQNQIISVFVEHGAMLLALDSSINSFENKFVLTLCCNLEHGDLSPRELAIQLQSMKYVTSTEYCEIRGRLFGRRLAGIAFNNKQSAVALRSSTLINLGRRLAKETGSIGTAALYEEGREYAHGVMQELGQILNLGLELGYPIATDYNQEDLSQQRSVEAYCVKCRSWRLIQNPRQVILSNKSSALQGVCPVCVTRVFKIGAKIYGKIRCGPLIENVQAFLMATGWGTFELRSEIEGRLGEVIISDPPTAEGDVPYGNQFVQGVAAGLLEIASGTKNRMRLVGENYDRYDRTLTLRFAEQIPVKTKAKRLVSIKTRQPKISTERKQELAPSAPKEAEVEVDRIIRSLEKIESDAKTSVAEDQKALEEQAKVGSQFVMETVPSQDYSDS